MATTVSDAKRNLVELAEELYTEGYQCGISGPVEDKWFKAWAEVMFNVAHGKPYERDSVIKAFEQIKDAK